MKNKALDTIANEGEGYKVEFKEKVSGLDREMVAFANASGGRIFIGIKDNGDFVGTPISNSLKSKVQDIAHNCDPAIRIVMILHKHESVLEVIIEEGFDKPYRCREGFFLRNGPSSQKLKRNEIIDVLLQKVRFDEVINPKFSYPEDFSTEKFNDFLSKANIHVQSNPEEVLFNIGIAQNENNEFRFTNAAVLFFAKSPQSFFPEAFITCVKYQGKERFSIIDQKDFKGSIIEQIEAAYQFLQQHTVSGIQVNENSARHTRQETYPIIALREAIINAITHRDYVYDGTHIYVHFFSDRIEIENPGGLCHGMKIEQLGTRSIRRNRAIADLLHRSGYIERIGSGFARMQHLLIENQNPPMSVSATNFFNIQFYPRAESEEILNLTKRQQDILGFIKENASATQSQLSAFFQISSDTTQRELRKLITAGFVEKIGNNRSSRYKLL